MKEANMTDEEVENMREDRRFLIEQGIIEDDREDEDAVEDDCE